LRQFRTFDPPPKLDLQGTEADNRRMKWPVWFACLLCVALFTPRAGRAEEIIAHGRFAQVHVYRPARKPRQFVLFLSGKDGWNAAAAQMVSLLVRRGANWIGAPADAKPILSDARKLHAATTLCLYGEGDDDALCPDLPAESVTAQELPGGHHFNGAYDDLADKILARLD
jgi:type IV secretory pathway VirJ component